MTTPPVRSRRGKAFLNEEDVALCISWLTISQDPVIGIGQPMSNNPKPDETFYNPNVM